MTCPHPHFRLIDPRPAVRLNGRVLRWAMTCGICRETVLVDADTGEHGGRGPADVGEHDDNTHPPAA